MVASTPNAVPRPEMIVPRTVSPIPTATTTAPTLSALTMKPRFCLIQSLATFMTRMILFARSWSVGASAAPMLNAPMRMTFQSRSSVSEKTSAAWASSVLMVRPSCRACSCNTSIPRAPLANIGRSCVPDRPKIVIASAALRVGSSIRLIRSASSLNCCSGLRPSRLATVSPRSANASVAVLRPRSAS